MKEIKFRLVNKGKIVGYEEHLLRHIISIMHSVDQQHWYNIRCEEHLNKWIEHDEKEQFTGLLDKKGKEIYEGDVVSYVDRGNAEMHLFKEVIYDGSCFGVNETNDCFMPLDGFCSDENHKGSHEGYVVGNIHENPELLKGA